MCKLYLRKTRGKDFQRIFEITNIWFLFCFLKREIGFHESEKHEELIPLRDMMFVLKAEQSEMTGRGRAGRLSGKGQYKKAQAQVEAAYHFQQTESSLSV